MVDAESCPDLGDLILSFFDLTEGRKYREEFQIYMQNQETISKNFIRTYIADKIQGNKDLLIFIERWKKGELTVDDIPNKKNKERRNRSSSTFSRNSMNEEDDNKAFINVIGRNNIELVLQKKAKISIACLVRLRMYQLAKGITMSPDGNMVFVIAPQIENRINILQPEGQKEEMG